MSMDQAKRVQALYHALLLDVRREMPDLLPTFLEATDRLMKLIETRGISVVTIDLPKLGKIFDKGLSSGWFNSSLVPPVLGSGKKKDFVLSTLLYERFFDPMTDALQPEDDPTLIFFIRTYLYWMKKVVKESTDEGATEVTRDFFRTDEALRRPHHSWYSDWLDCDDIAVLSFTGSLKRFEEPELFEFPKPTRYITGILPVLDRVCRLTSSMFGNLAPNEIIGRHGPGAVVDIKTGDDKYTFPTWPRKLGLVFPHELHAHANDEMLTLSDYSPSLNEPMAKLCAVPKDHSKPRLITVEPASHQFLQQGLMRWFRKNLPSHLRIAIDFQSQDPSRDLVLESSRTGEMMSVDLSSASDLLSLWTVERAFSGNLTILRALHAVRTRTVRNATGFAPDKVGILLRKYAGQGNATTFPVQSCIYACCAIAALIYQERGSCTRITKRMLKSAARKVRVYGDDIILPSSAGPWFSEILSFLQLRINWDKTHKEGHFRESCGMDAYMGYDVTPLYLQSLAPIASRGKHIPQNLVSWMDVCNNAYRKGLWSLSWELWCSVPMKYRRLIPCSREPQECVTLFTYTNSASFQFSRYSYTLQRLEVRSIVSTSREVREERNSPMSLLQWFVEGPSQEINWSSGWTRRNRVTLSTRWVPFQQ